MHAEKYPSGEMAKMNVRTSVDAGVKSQDAPVTAPAAPAPKIKVDVLTGIKRVIAANLGLTQEERDELTPDDVVDCDNRIGMDELDRVEVMFGIEEEFGIDISDDEFAQARTIGGLVKVVEAKTTK